MADGLAWPEVAAAYDSDVGRLRAKAHDLYTLMTGHLRAEAERTGARIELMEPGSVLPKGGSAGTIAMRMDVTPTTALYARQPHVAEGGRERHRSWPIDLETASTLPRNVASGLTRVVEDIARLQERASRSDQAVLLVQR